MFWLNKLIETAKVFSVQNQQYTERIPLEGISPANSTLPFKTNISNLGHFLCLFVTGHYETLYKVIIPENGMVDHIVDDGICHLRMQLEDGGTGQRLLFMDYAPMDLFLSPGRIRSARAENNLVDTRLALRADPAPQLFYPVEEQYLFTANGDIIAKVKNDSNADIAFSMLFYGIRKKAFGSVAGVKKN